MEKREEKLLPFLPRVVRGRRGQGKRRSPRLSRMYKEGGKGGGTKKKKDKRPDFDPRRSLAWKNQREKRSGKQKEKKNRERDRRERF